MLELAHIPPQDILGYLDKEMIGVIFMLIISYFIIRRKK